IKNIPLIGNLVDGGTSSIEEVIVIQVRLPRVLAAAIVGIALAVAGVVLQALLRNPMADPYVIGISAGASLGASIAIAFGISLSFLGLLYSVPVLAFVVALITVIVVYSIARTGQGVPMLTLLLVGIAANSFLMAIMSIIRIVSGEAIHAIMIWILGSLVTCNWNHVKIALPFVMIGVALIYVFARDLNIILLGEEQARHLGVDTERLKKIMLTSATLITAAAVSISGIIGFIGLIIPHIARILVGPDHRILIPSSALAGAIVLILCDTIARTIIRPAELPVGIFTSLLGGPFFIYLIRKRKRSVIW
ncbi:MAG: iron chelate uptake ABC transporter family permease subunit, partial [Candidatus Bathyarchaeota archaeon]